MARLGNLFVDNLMRLIRLLSDNDVSGAAMLSLSSCVAMDRTLISFQSSGSPVAFMERFTSDQGTTDAIAGDAINGQTLLRGFRCVFRDGNGWVSRGARYAY